MSRTRPSGPTLLRRLPVALLAVVALSAGVAACVPGSGGSGSAPSSSGPVSTAVPSGKTTLTVWDQEVRGGQKAAITKLNAEFEKKYPNVTIKRVAKSFNNLKDTLKLALSGKNPPDVVEANQGYPDMGAFVKAGMLQPLNEYAGSYGWRNRWSSTLLDLNSFTPDGKTFGQGNLYGVSMTGEMVGVYYNKKKLKQLGLSEPKTWAEFTAMLPKIKAKGQQPIMFGNKDQWPAIHTFGVVQDRSADAASVRNLVFGKQGATWNSPATTKAATTLQTWADKGWLSPGANGLGYDAAGAQYAKGKGVFLITGTWLAPDLEKTLKGDLGFMLPPPASAGGQVTTTGGQGLAWSVTSKSKNQALAAAYIDFITNAHAADVMTQTGNLPAMAAASAKPAAGVQTDIADAWKQVRDADGLVPYLDYSTPNFYDTLTVQLQKLVGKQNSPKQCVAALQQDYGTFQQDR